MPMVLGNQRPRLESLPVFASSKGEDALALGETAGLFLDPWQQYCLTNSLGQDKKGLWSAFEVCIIVSRQNGKGSILEARELAGLYLFSSDRLLIHTAHEHKTSSEHYRRMWSLIDNTPELRKKVARYSSAYGREFIELVSIPTLITGSGGKHITRKERPRLIFIARSQGSGRGFTGDLLVYDEDMILEAAKVGASLPSLSARPNPQVWYTGSAGLATSDQLALIRRRGVAGTSKKLFFAEWSINWHSEYCEPTCTEHDDPGTPEALAKANPALGIRITPEFCEAEADAMGGVHSEEYQRERLGVGTYPAPLDGWLLIPEKWWNETTEDDNQMPSVTSLRNIVFAVHTSRDRKITTIAVAGMRPDKLVQVEIADRRAGTGWVLARVAELFVKHKPICVVLDKRAAAGSKLDELEKNDDLTVEAMAATDVAYACGQFFDAFCDGAVRHGKEPGIRKALAACDWRPLSESRAFDERNCAVDATPLMAAAFALWGHKKYSDVEYDATKSVHFDLAYITELVRNGVYDLGDLYRLNAERIITEEDIATVLSAARR